MSRAAVGDGGRGRLSGILALSSGELRKFGIGWNQAWKPSPETRPGTGKMVDDPAPVHGETGPFPVGIQALACSCLNIT